MESTSPGPQLCAEHQHRVREAFDVVDRARERNRFVRQRAAIGERSGIEGESSSTHEIGRRRGRELARAAGPEHPSVQGTRPIECTLPTQAVDRALDRLDRHGDARSREGGERMSGALDHHVGRVAERLECSLGPGVCIVACRRRHVLQDRVAHECMCEREMTGADLVEQAGTQRGRELVDHARRQSTHHACERGGDELRSEHGRVVE